MPLVPYWQMIMYEERVPPKAELPVISALTAKGAVPVTLSNVALIKGGVPAAPPIRTTVLWRAERFSALSMACVLIRYAPAALIGELNDVPVRQHRPNPPELVCHKSQAVDPPRGSVTGKLT